MKTVCMLSFVFDNPTCKSLASVFVEESYQSVCIMSSGSVFYVDCISIISYVSVCIYIDFPIGLFPPSFSVMKNFLFFGCSA